MEKIQRKIISVKEMKGLPAELVGYLSHAAYYHEQDREEYHRAADMLGHEAFKIIKDVRPSEVESVKKVLQQYFDRRDVNTQDKNCNKEQLTSIENLILDWLHNQS